MKNQTKAILASVMILALALSSIGGATYSWFSDTEEVVMNTSTGSVDITTKLYKGSTTGPVPGQIISPPPEGSEQSQETQQITMEKLTAPLADDSTDNYRLKITNNHMPVIASVYVIIERFSAYTDNTRVGEVYATYDGSGNITGYQTYDEFFNGNTDRGSNIGSYLKFGTDPSSPTQKAAWNGQTVYAGYNVEVQKYDPITETTLGTYGTYDIRYFEYVCYLGDIVIGDQESDEFDFSVQFEKGYKSYIMQKMYVETIATQIEGGIQSCIFNSENKASANVDGNTTIVDNVRPVLFLGTDFRITVDAISIFKSGITKIDVGYSRNDTILTVDIYFKDAEGDLKEPVSGNIRIQSYNSEHPCLLILPSHSYTISLNVGGAST